MNFLKIIVISILIVIILFNAIGLQIFSIFNKTFLEPSFYKKIGTEQEFYAQIRQLMFRLINQSLPHGREGMPYIEQALTESWLKNELDELISQFLDFAKERIDEPPIIPIYKLKERVVQSIDEDKSLVEKERMVQYWFDPLPDKVRLQDFISSQLISQVNITVINVRWILCIIIGIIILLSGLMYLVVQDVKTATLWILAAIMTSGIQVILIGLGIDWLFKRSSYIVEFYNSIVAFEIPKESAWGLIQAIKNGFTDPLILVGAVVAAVSAGLIYFIPIQERNLTLIK